MVCTRSWSQCRPFDAVDVRELTPVDVLIARSNRRKLSRLVEAPNAASAYIVGALGVLAGVPDGDDLIMHRADKTRALGALHPVPLRAGKGLVIRAVGRRGVHSLQALLAEVNEDRASLTVLEDVDC